MHVLTVAEAEEEEEEVVVVVCGFLWLLCWYRCRLKVKTM